MTQIVPKVLTIYNTLNCNFRCAHCMRGIAQKESISLVVLEKLFQSIKAMDFLKITGGEPLMDLQSLKEILKTIKKYNIPFYKLYMSTNGSLFSEEAKGVLDEYNDYITKCRKAHFVSDALIGQNIEISISMDEYHNDYMESIKAINPSLAHKYRSNIIRLLESEYYYETMGLSDVWKAGKAELLPDAQGDVVNYEHFYVEDGDLILVMPTIIVLPDGTLTELNGSIKDLKTRFNYGNILETDLADLIRDEFQRCSTLEEMFVISSTSVFNINKEIPVITSKHVKCFRR